VWRQYKKKIELRRGQDRMVLSGAKPPGRQLYPHVRKRWADASCLCDAAGTAEKKQRGPSPPRVARGIGVGGGPWGGTCYKSCEGDSCVRTAGTHSGGGEGKESLTSETTIHRGEN